MFPFDHDFVGLLAGAYMRKNKAVLVFCPSKTGCEEQAKKMAKIVPIGYASDQFSDVISEACNYVSSLRAGYCQPPNNQMQKERQKLVTELTNTPSGLCEILGQTILNGVAYHHSGLTPEEREIVERGYRQGLILCLCATSTLSTGINLPAKVVIFKGGP